MLLERGEGDARIAADSTMLRMVNLFIALSLGVHREQLEQRMGLTWPRPFLLRPLRRSRMLVSQLLKDGRRERDAEGVTLMLAF